jgi:hypothetical protein
VVSCKIVIAIIAAVGLRNFATPVVL